MQRYTHIFYCPVTAFCHPGNDSARVKEMVYHEIYDLVLKAFLDRYRPTMPAKIGTLHDSELEDRKRTVSALLR